MVLSLLAVPLGASPAAATADEQFVTRLYSEFLLREPTANELAWQTAVLANGTSRTTVASNVIGSTEGKSLYVIIVYQLTLSRFPTSSESSSGVSQLSSGTLTFESSVAASAEYFDLAGSTNEGYVQKLYEDILRRTGSSTDVAYWADQITSGTRTRGWVATNFIKSAESSNRRVAGPDVTDVQQVTDVFAGSYCIILNRMASSADKSYWSSHLQASGNVLTLWSTIAGSSEYYTSS
jgi:hypothetical protein